MRTLSNTDEGLLSRQLAESQRIRVFSDLYQSGVGCVEYRAAGTVTAPAIVLLHGIGSNSECYRAQIAGLADDFRVVAWNAPGFGASTALRSDQPNAQDYAKALEALLAALGIQRIRVLVGSSWGSVIAMSFASLFPERLSSLVLSAPNTARGDLVGEARAKELAAVLDSLKGAATADRDAIVERLVTADTPRIVRAHVARLRYAITARGWAQAFSTLFTVYTPNVIGGIEVPISILVGDRDKVAPAERHALVLHERARGSVLEVFEGYGHILKLEAPSRFNDAVRRWAGASSNTRPR